MSISRVKNPATADRGIPHWYERMQWAMDAVSTFELDPCAAHTLLALIRWTGDKHRRVWPSKVTIAETIGMETRSVYRALDQLEKAGLLSRGSYNGKPVIRLRYDVTRKPKRIRRREVVGGDSVSPTHDIKSVDAMTVCHTGPDLESPEVPIEPTKVKKPHYGTLGRRIRLPADLREIRSA